MVHKRANAKTCSLGYTPEYQDLDWHGLNDIDQQQFKKLMAIEPQQWAAEIELHKQFFAKFDGHLPSEFFSILEKMQQSFACHNAIEDTALAIN